MGVVSSSSDNEIDYIKEPKPWWWKKYTDGVYQYFEDIRYRRECKRIDKMLLPLFEPIR